MGEATGPPASGLFVVMLAGTLRPSPIREVLNLPEVCLPVDRDALLLDAWCAALQAAGGIEDVLIVVNSDEDVRAVEAAASRSRTRTARPSLRIMAEPTAWRGTGGILRDVTDGLAEDQLVLMAEAACLPPDSLDALPEAMKRHDGGVVGVGGDQEPAGVYVFTRRALRRVPPIGYHDVKEQLLPALHHAGLCVGTVRLGDAVHRIRDRRSYLSAVRHRLGGNAASESSLRAELQTSVSGAAVLDGRCLVEPGAVVEGGAVVHDSVVMTGATVRGGAVVSRSVIGPRATVEAQSRIVRRMLVESGAVERTAPAGELVG